jgi:hypothetical protein
VLTALVACSSWQTGRVPVAAGSAGTASDSVPLGKPLRVQTNGGASYELTDAVVVHDSIVGWDTGTRNRVGIPLADVRTVATHRVSVARTSVLVLGLAAIAILLAATAATASLGNIQ